jgi:GNAT superfamily N-acetyltransferase
MLRAPEALRETHVRSTFQCGKPALDDWFARHALHAQQAGSARTFVVCDDEIVAGYFSLTVGQVEAADAPARIGKGMGRHPIPVVVLARLAVAEAYQGRGIGRGMLRDAVARTLVMAAHAGIRALLTHPLDEAAARFYLHFGFQASPLDDRQLLLLLKDARRLQSP